MRPTRGERERRAGVLANGLEAERGSRPPVPEKTDMAKAVQKIKLSPSRDIPFNKLVLSQSNVRRVKAGISIEDLAEDIAHREKLLQSLYARPILDADGQETGMFEVPAGGRRYRALELLVKQKRLAKTAPVPCIVCKTGGEISAEEDSLAENVHRVALHPLDQFRAFQTLREQKLSEEDIAAIFFVSPQVVKQRLRLAAVSPKLLAEAGTIAAEGWKWIEVAASFPYGHDHGLRRLEGIPADLTAEEQAIAAALQAEYTALQEKYEDADELPDEVDARLGELEEALEAFENRPDIFKPAEMVHAGAFVSIDAEGALQVARGYVRREDEAAFVVATAEPDPAPGAAMPDTD